MKYFIVIAMILGLVSCQRTAENKTKCYGSYELVGPHQDTVNLLDCDKRKQGKWIPSPTNDLKDTVFYRNDSVISHLN